MMSATTHVNKRNLVKQRDLAFHYDMKKIPCAFCNKTFGLAADAAKHEKDYHKKQLRSLLEQGKLKCGS